MKVVNFPKQLNQLEEKTLILGGFETIHIGHETLVEAAKQFGKPVVITLSKDPTTLPSSDGKAYSTLEHRLGYLADLGVDYAVVVDFTKTLLKTHGDTFMKELMDTTHSVNIVAGKDFKYGKDAKYDSKYLKEHYANVEIVELVKVNDKKISTTLLKESVALGDLDLVHDITNHPYEVETNVSDGHTFSFKEQVVPHSGIYSGFLRASDYKYVIAIHVDMQGHAHLKMQDIQKVKKISKASIIFHSLVRKIVKTADDHYKENDMNLVIDNLELLYNN